MSKLWTCGPECHACASDPNLGYRDLCAMKHCRSFSEWSVGSGLALCGEHYKLLVPWEARKKYLITHLRDTLVVSRTEVKKPLSSFHDNITRIEKLVLMDRAIEMANQELKTGR